MTSDALLILQSIFRVIWRLFTSWYIPGTHVTPAAWALFCLVVLFLVRFIKTLGGSKEDD